MQVTFRQNSHLGMICVPVYSQCHTSSLRFEHCELCSSISSVWQTPSFRWNLHGGKHGCGDVLKSEPLIHPFFSPGAMEAIRDVIRNYRLIKKAMQFLAFCDCEIGINERWQSRCG